MGERKQALSNKAYLKLKDVYENRDKYASRWKQKGGKVALILGADVPEEILYAAKYLPIAVSADYGKPTDTDLYLEPTGDKDAWSRGVVQKLIDGTYKKFADRIIISYDTCRNFCLSNVLKEARRQMPDSAIPYVTFVETCYERNLLGETHNDRIYAEFRQKVECWTGRELSNEEINAAIDVYEDDRAAMREFDALRSGEESRVTGTEAMVVLGSSLFMDKKEHAALVRKVTADAANWPVVKGVRFVITGSDQDIPELYELVEKCGGNIVSEDHNYGTRMYAGSFSEYTRSHDPVRALVDRYTYRMPIGKVLVKEHVDSLRAIFEKAAPEAFIMYLKVNDIGSSWDYPRIKDLCESFNIPIIRFYYQETPMKNAPEVEAEIKKAIACAKGGN